MAFATLCMSRLWHGFSTKAEEPVIFTNRFFNNKAGLAAFTAGMICLNGVLLIPALNRIFKIAPDLGGTQIAIIYALSFGSMCVIQLIKFIAMTVRNSGKK